MALLGTIHAGLGCTGLNKILACCDIPTIPDSLYKRYEQEVGLAIEKAALESCRRAISEERELVLQKIKEICKQL